MKTLTFTLAPIAALALGTAVFAQAELDTDGDGVMSYDELVVGYPDLTQDTFVAIDTDADGSVSPDELAAAVEAGTLPAM